MGSVEAPLNDFFPNAGDFLSYHFSSLFNLTMSARTFLTSGKKIVAIGRNFR